MNRGICAIRSSFLPAFEQIEMFHVLNRLFGNAERVS
ncbi:hypothetical protein BBOH_0514 [Bifidobacterium bohemicum DSM 22767]|uniref:Uncharacterized protein n=1 Tax=Bifidobacterium bohemicum DSM 22767 TaxID=1437606 RepID=A0A086ZGR3_9BIFI|nr:hypothetical protein BBOH_0514 [Bifidobacterium bohemicum DSM 22767]